LISAYPTPQECFTCCENTDLVIADDGANIRFGLRGRGFLLYISDSLSSLALFSRQ